MFSGQNVLVLGASCELGLCLSQYLIKADLFPWLTCRNEERVLEITRELADFSGEFKALVLDFAKEPKMIDTLFSQMGCEPDFLVDLVHPDLECLTGNASDKEISEYFSESIAFRAALLKRTARIMLKKRKGRLVYISSSAAARANPGQGFYAAAKLAAEAMYRNLGLEMGSRGITTVTLRPGYIRAGRGRDYVQKNARAIQDRVPTGRALDTEQVAETIMFLLSDSASGFNATEITLDGGMSAAK